MNLRSLSTFFGPSHGDRLGMALAGLLAGLTAGCGQPTEAEFIANAKRFQESGKLQASVIELKNALGKNPDNPEARRLLGLVMLQLGNAPAAEKELKRAMELGMAPETLALPLSEAFALQRKYAEILDLGDVPESMPASDRAAFLAYRGDAWFSTGKPDRARAEYNAALRLDQGASRAKAGLARLAAANRDFKEAHRLLAEALEQDGGNGLLWRLQAQFFQKEGKLAEAESSYSKAIEKNRSNEIDHVMRTLIRAELGKLGEAAEDIEAIKKTAPKAPSTHYAAGVLAYMQGHLSEASVELEEAYRIDDRFLPVQFALGSTKFRLGQLEQAEQLISRYLLAEPDSERGILTLALIKFNKKDFGRARDLLLPVMNRFPRQDLPLTLMGLSEFALGHGEQGMKYFTRAIEIASPSSQRPGRSGENTPAMPGSVHSDQTNPQDPLPPDYFPDTIPAILAYLKSGQTEQAEALAAEMKGRMKDSPLPDYLLQAMSRLHSGPGGKPRR